MITTTTAPVTHNANTHQCRADDRTAGSAYRRQLLATVLMLASLTGHSDGETYAVCVGCGENAYVGGNPRNMDTLNLGHVLADANGGTYCVANMLPLCRQCNEDMGKESLTDVLVPLYDNRSMWNGKLIKDMGKVKQEPQANRGQARWNRPESV
ncbi:HNH endonuclease [Streptomyces phage Wofford]|uniref:HNH endonuclease n=1 Tax=Streptomyces phage Wofford TaxID=2283267 RepID=A0A345M9Q0_9CAUD|nr:HNH endonuclease [Streptomyces phage Wollford]YP_009839925.1 HNH endonuclease [Streptomyces phage Wollford]AXH67221.1 HNH endonuclease [Streptomyces phage Wollford]AXH67415.1 HNH endonuclease [Streptomyces phage Wollford]